MKVELTVNLKTAKGNIIRSGSVFSDKDAPIPAFILQRLAKGQARIIEYNPAPEKIEEKKRVIPVTVVLEKTEKKRDIPVTVVPEKTEKKKKLLKKTSA